MKLNPHLTSKKVRIFTNAPFYETVQFDRLKYNEFKWIYHSSSRFNDSNRYVCVKCFKPGSFHCYFTLDRTT